ncbi:MAG: hypothetical protein ACYC26_13045, partial [Phycisphaerales bacterium]
MCNVPCAMCNVMRARRRRGSASSTSHIEHRTSNIPFRGFSYVATCQPVLGWGAGIVSGSGQSAIGARNLDGHAAHEIV